MDMFYIYSESTDVLSELIEFQVRARPLSELIEIPVRARISKEIDHTVAPTKTSSRSVHEQH